MKSLLASVLFLVGSMTASASSMPFLSSQAAYVQDAQTGEVLLDKNSGKAMPIASLTKLMTSMVVLDDAGFRADETVFINESDVDNYKKSHSRLQVGSVWSKEQLLQLALIASDNRAAHALARTSSYGLEGFVFKMNTKASTIGMNNTIFTDPTGLQETNTATPSDIARMVSFAAQYAQIRQYSTTKEVVYSYGGQKMSFQNTNAVVRDNIWPQLWLSKTGYIQEAGRCVAMMGKLAGKAITVVLMDSNNSNARTFDVRKIQAWIHGEEIAQPIATKMQKVSLAKSGSSTTRKSAVKTKKQKIAVKKDV